MDSHIAHFEHLPPQSYLIRVGSIGWTFGEPYELIVVAIDIGDGVCEIRGLDKPISIGDWRAIAKAAAAQGFQFVVFDRIKNGVKRRKKIDLAFCAKIDIDSGNGLQLSSPLRMESQT